MDFSKEDCINVLSLKSRCKKKRECLQGYIRRQKWSVDLSEEEVEDICLRGVIKRFNVGHSLYRKDARVKQWFVLLSGNIIIGNVLFASGVCFGRAANSTYRTEDCLVLDPSTIIMVEYTVSDGISPGSINNPINNPINNNNNTINNKNNNNSNNNNSTPNYQKTKINSNNIVNKNCYDDENQMVLKTKNIHLNGNDNHNYDNYNNHISYNNKNDNSYFTYPPINNNSHPYNNNICSTYLLNNNGQDQDKHLYYNNIEPNHNNLSNIIPSNNNSYTINITNNNPNYLNNNINNINNNSDINTNNNNIELNNTESEFTSSIFFNIDGDDNDTIKNNKNDNKRKNNTNNTNNNKYDDVDDGGADDDFFSRSILNNETSNNNKNNNANINKVIANSDNDEDDIREDGGDGNDEILRKPHKNRKFIKSHSFSVNEFKLKVLDDAEEYLSQNQALSSPSTSSSSSNNRNKNKINLCHYKRENHQSIDNSEHTSHNSNNSNKSNNNYNNYSNNHFSNYSHNSDTSSYISENLSSFIESAIDSEHNMGDDDDDENDEDDVVTRSGGHDNDAFNSGHDDDTGNQVRPMNGGVMWDELMRTLVNGRGEREVEIICNFLKQQPVLKGVSVQTKKKLAKVAKQGRVDGNGVVVVRKGQQMDSWGLLLKGYLEIIDGDCNVEGVDGDATVIGGLKNKMVEIERGEDGKILQPGNCFGVEASEEAQFYKENIRTASPYCVFLLVPQMEYAAIMKNENKNIREIMEDGEVVGVVEDEENENGVKKPVLLRATPDYLLKELFQCSSLTNNNYLDMFLLTYRTFFKFPSQLAYKLMDFFDEHKTQVVLILLTWMSSFPEDFEMDADMTTFMHQLSVSLQLEGMNEEVKELENKFALISRPRELTLLRSTRDELLYFHIINHPSLPSSTFVNHVEEKGFKQGLRVGDEILEVNKKSFENILHKDALSFLTQQTHLCLVLKYNKPGLKRLLYNHKEKAEKHETNKKQTAQQSTDKSSIDIKTKLNLQSTPSTLPFPSSSHSSKLKQSQSNPPSPLFLHPNPSFHPSISDLPLDLEEDSSKSKVVGRIRDSWAKLWMPKSSSLSENSGMANKGRFSTSHPDLSKLYHHNNNNNNNNNTSNINKNNKYVLNKYNTTRDISFVDSHYARNTNTNMNNNNNNINNNKNNNNTNSLGDFEVIKVYREDQSFKFILVDKCITAKQVVMLALKEFGMVHKNSLQYSLYKVSLQKENFVKKQRLPDHTNNLPELATFRSRYYLKNITEDIDLLPDTMVEDFREECQISFLNLSVSQVAIQLTLNDHECYRNVKLSEFINQLFNLEPEDGGGSSGSVGGGDDSGGGSRNSTLKKSSLITATKSNEIVNYLQRFSKLPNKELFWVVSNLCSESSTTRRARCIRHFIYIAKHCIDCRNFNSAFNIISGLGHQSVSRLRHTWDKVPEKATKLLETMQSLLDPSRNMKKYRTLVCSQPPPLIPFYPMVIKDLTAIELNHKNKIDGMVNVQKLRLIASEVTKVKSYAPTDMVLTESMLNSLVNDKKHSSRLDPVLIVSSLSHKKKFYESRQMAQKVQAYLENINVIEDEVQLSDMSNTCEGGQTQRSESSQALNKNLSVFGTNSPSQLRTLQGLTSDNKYNLLTLSKLRKSMENLAFSSSSPPSSRTKGISVFNNQKLSITTSEQNIQGSKLLNKIKKKEKSEKYKENNTNARKTDRMTRTHIETDSGRFSYSGDDRSIGSSGDNQSSSPISVSNRLSSKSIPPPRPPQPSNITPSSSSRIVSTSQSETLSKQNHHALTNKQSKNYKTEFQRAKNGPNLLQKLNFHANNATSKSSSNISVTVNKETNVLSFQTKPLRINIPDSRKPPSGRTSECRSPYKNNHFSTHSNNYTNQNHNNNPTNENHNNNPTNQINNPANQTYNNNYSKNAINTHNKNSPISKNIDTFYDQEQNNFTQIDLV